MADATSDGGPTSSSSGFSRALGANVEEDWIKWDVMERDWNALVALYEATGGDNWTNNEGWLTETPLGDWYGVNLLRDGRVDHLELENNNLIGEIPAELADLTTRRLDLSHNQLSGEIPEELCSQGTLDLSHNQLSGPIPQGVVGCNGPGHLFLNNNQLSGEIPAEWGAEPDLEYVQLNDNQLSGEIPPELSNTAMRELHLKNNQFSGEVPKELSDSPLRVLDLTGNQMSGCMPDSIRDIEHVRWPDGVESFCYE